MKQTKPAQAMELRSLSPVFGDYSKDGAAPAGPRGSIRQGQAMAQVKKAVLELVKKLPPDCTLEDVQYQLYVRQKIDRSMLAAASGRVTSHEQVKKRLSKWLAR
jgi:predicted transcriptional regulator